MGAAMLAFAGSGGFGCHGASAPTPIPISVEPGYENVKPSSENVEPSGQLVVENPAYERAVAYSAEHGGLALVVIEGDRVALAIGQNGHPVDEAHPLHGASESFWGPVAIAAETDGLLDLDEPVSSAIQEWDGIRWKDDMRVRHLLQYTSGLESGVWPLLREKPANHYERALALEMIAEPGERFQVGPSHLAVFGEFLRRRFAPEGFDALAFLEQRILEPIGLELAGWERDAAGNPDLANGARMTAYHWAKFGVLMRDRGRWQGEVVLDEAGIEACLEPGDVQPRFGLTFWLNPVDTRAADASEPSDGDRLGALAMAAGAGNQRLYVITGLNLVVARFGEEDREWRDPDFLDLIAAGAASDPERFASDR